jgi:hypothetical protein
MARLYASCEAGLNQQMILVWYNGTAVTNKAREFPRVPNLPVADWTVLCLKALRFVPKRVKRK